MSERMTLNVDLDDALGDHVARTVGEDGDYATADDYVRDLIRRDKERAEREALETLKAELQRAFATPDSEYIEMDVETFLERAQARWHAKG
jgi:antitoxin ParD1/3/4